MQRESSISLGALGVGAVLGIAFSASAMYAGQKTGIIDGGNIPAALLAFGALSIVMRRRPTGDDGNIVQTVSSSAAMMAITGGLTGPVAALAIQHAMPSVPLVIVWGVALGIVGTLLAIPLRTAFIVRNKLPFPSGAATAEVLEDVFAKPPGQADPAVPLARIAGTRSVRSRVWLLAIGGAVAFVLVFGRARGWVPVPEMYLVPGTLLGLALSHIYVGVGFSPLLVGVGYLAGARTAVSLVIGSALAFIVIASQLVTAGITQPAYLVGPGEGIGLLDWLLFAGTGLMLGGTVGSAAGTVRDFRTSLRDVSAAGGLRMTRSYALALAVGSVAVVALGTVTFDVSPLIPLFALALSAVLCAAAVHAMGETDNTPAGPLGGFAQLVVGSIAPGGTAAPLSGGGVVNGTLMHASMMMQNWKTGARVGTSPRAQIVAQLVGVVVGAITCAGVFALLEAAYGLGSEAMPAPAALSWKATAEIAEHGISSMPAYAPLGAAIAFVAGCVLSLKSIARYAPSPVAMGMAFILPPFMSVTIAIGGLLYWIAARRSKKTADEEGVALASGLIGGEALAGLVIAALLILER